MSNQQSCPCCGQSLPEIRLGVELPPLKARIFDLVQRGGRDGIATSDLFDLVYNSNCPNGKGIREAGRTPKSIGTHINQINEAIENSGYRIVGRRGVGGAYRLVRR